MATFPGYTIPDRPLVAVECMSGIVFVRAPGPRTIDKAVRIAMGDVRGLFELKTLYCCVLARVTVRLFVNYRN